MNFKAEIDSSSHACAIYKIKTGENPGRLRGDSYCERFARDD
jgi:hypothetical protein